MTTDRPINELVWPKKLGLYILIEIQNSKQLKKAVKLKFLSLNTG